MKHCPGEGCEHRISFGRAAEFLDSVEVCSDCGSLLRDGEAPPEAEPAVEYRELITVYETNDQVQAHIIRCLLEAQQIPVHIGGEALQGAMGEIPLTMLSIRVQVPVEHARQAREIALASEDASGE